MPSLNPNEAGTNRLLYDMADRSTFTLAVAENVGDDGTTALTATIPAPGAGKIIVPRYFRITHQDRSFNALSSNCVIERYSAGDVPGTDTPLISTKTLLDPLQVNRTTLGLCSEVWARRWETASPIEVGAVAGSAIENTSLHIAFDAKAATEDQYIAVNYYTAKVIG